jgi:putative membrane protein
MTGGDLLAGLIQASPFYLLVAFVAIRARTLAREGRPVPTFRLALIAAGVAVGVLADLPPVGTLSEERLSVHMLQHMLIGDLAAFLIVIGMTGPLLRPILTKPGVRRLRWLAHPLVAVPLWIVVYYGWHAPALYQAALHSNVVHATEHASMFAAGLALWMGLLGPLPKPSWFGAAAGLAYVVVVRFAGTVIANVFLWSSSPFYPDYVALARAHGIDAAEDQSLAGAIWMIEGSVVTICVLGWLFVRWMRQGEEAQELVEHARARGLDLDPARARRAVAAGAGARLRARLDSEDGAAQQDEADDDGGDHEHAQQEAEGLRLRAQRVDHRM